MSFFNHKIHLTKNSGASKLYDLKTPFPAFPHGGRSACKHISNALSLSPLGEIRKGVLIMLRTGVITENTESLNLK
jgi:hypothetical protein